MIDTIKFLIPLKSQKQLNYITKNLTRIKKDDISTGKIYFEYHFKSINVGSYDRTVSLKTSLNPLGIFVEFSLPKYILGNNVEMVKPSDCLKVFSTLTEYNLYKDLKFALGCSLPLPQYWIVYRLDICYNWVMRSEKQALDTIDFLKRIDFPRKKKYVYPTSVMNLGTSYVVKFYHKGEEFKRHDFKELDYFKAKLLQSYANKIVRFEVGIRKSQLEYLFSDTSTKGDDNFSVYDLLQNKLVKHMLNYYLHDKVFAYYNPVCNVGLSILERLQVNFGRAKSLRLFNFYNSYYNNSVLHDFIVNGGMNRMTIYRYKSDLKKAGVGYDFGNNETSVNLDFLRINDNNSFFCLEKYLLKRYISTELYYKI